MENGTAEDSKGNNKFQEAVSAWKGIDLTHLMPSLDSTASEIVDHQRDSLVQRKELAQKTKDFRKLDDASKLNEIKGLLKAYQGFVDVLTNHSKGTSSGFLKVYSLLSEAPDPYPLLETSIDSLLASEATIPQLTQENKELKANVAKLTAQIEDNEKRLNHETSARKNAEENTDAKVKEVETSWTAVLTEKEDNWQAKEKSLEERAETFERQMKELRASYEVTQRLDRPNDDSGLHNRAMAAELDMVSGDLERTRLRLAEVESRNEQLRTDLAQSASQKQHVNVEDSPSFVRLQSENSSLLRKLDSSRTDRESQKRDFENRLKSLERQINSIKHDRDGIREKLRSWSDYDEVKQELEMLRSIEFATAGDVDDEDSDSEITANGSSNSLEQLLLARNKKLSNELTILRVSHKDLQSRLDELQETNRSMQSDLNTSKTLNATLENDLLRLQQAGPAAHPALSVAGTYTSRHPAASNYGSSRRAGRVSPTSSLISGFEPASEFSPSPSGGNSGILPMITAQRDRFKTRNAALETELSTSQSTITSLRSEIASLQKDNLNLYEKTRYVSSFNRSSGTSYTASNASNGTADQPMERYRSAYESQMSPFAAFRGRESARALRRLSLPERIVFSVTRLVLATRTSRNLFALYCVVLHGLVFFMLYSGGGDSGVMLANTGGAAMAGGLHGSGSGDTGAWEREGFEDGG